MTQQQGQGHPKRGRGSEQRGGRRPMVLVVDDVAPVIRMLTLELNSQGFDVVGAKLGEDTYRTIERYRPDVALMEVVLPGISGFELLREIKQRYDLPVVFVTTQGGDADRQFAIELGADDYITKPFNPQELGQRINLVLHRRSEPTAGVIRIDSVEIDLARRVLRKDGEAINLGANEWAIVYALVSQGRRPVSARDVLTAVWGGDYAHENEYLEIWIARLRKKVEADPGHPRVITGDARSGFAIGSATRRQMPESA